MKRSYASEISRPDPLDRLMSVIRFIKKPLVEMYYGIRTKTLPLGLCSPICVVLELCFLTRFDYWLISRTPFVWLYPAYRSWWWWGFYFTVILSPFTFWAFFQANKRDRLNRTLTKVFEAIGLRNNLGYMPRFIFDRPIDKTTRKLCVTRSVIPMATFRKVQDSLEGGLHIHIDEFRENTESGTVDIIYSNKAMPKICKAWNYKTIRTPRFFVGTNRSGEMVSSLDSTAHLLIAGQTGAGKSTFLRQFITTLYLNDDNCRFTLMDFKGSVEAELFGGLARIKVAENLSDAVRSLEDISKSMAYRFELLKANQCKDVDAYFRLPPNKRVSLPDTEGGIHPIPYRHIIVVDEAAEVFLASDQASASQVPIVKQILSKVARQGRSVWTHLVLATQRPDSRALDPQIKANLTGVLSFQMMNDASSILILGNGRATDLPPIAGRAIWKKGLDMDEVQTPLLEWEEATELLKINKVPPARVDTVSSEQREDIEPPVDLRERAREEVAES